MFKKSFSFDNGKDSSKDKKISSDKLVKKRILSDKPIESTGITESIKPIGIIEPDKNLKLLKIAKDKYGLIFKDFPDNINDIIQKRKLNSNKFWYMTNFSGFFNEINKGTNVIDYDPRLVIPFKDYKRKTVYALQGRSIFTFQETKYLTILLDETYLKLYNYYNINKNKNIKILEGPIDSMFFENSIALAGAQINEDILKELKNLDCTFIYDNDFIYNDNIRNQTEKMIKLGFKVYIPSEEYIQYKDINDLVVGKNLTIQEVNEIIDNNSFSGLQAKVKLSIVLANH